MPLFASDPHLGNSLPSFWLLSHLEFFESNRTLSGASTPGIPGMGIGRTNNIVWGLTTSRVDTSDMWQEKFNEAETKYMVDGEWRELESRTEVIKVKG